MATKYGLLYNQDKKNKKQPFGNSLGTEATSASSTGIYGSMPQAPNVDPSAGFKMPTNTLTPDTFSKSMQGTIAPPSAPAGGSNISVSESVIPTPTVDGSSGGDSQSAWSKMQGSEGMGKANSIVGATAGTAASLAQMGAGAIGKDAGVNYENIDDEIDEGKMKGAGALSGAGSGLAMGASIGSVIPGVGTAIGAAAGAVIGGIAGFFGGKKKAKDAKEERKKLIKKRTGARYRAKQADLTAQSTKMADAFSARYSKVEQLRGGGRFKLVIFSYDVQPAEGPIKKTQYRKIATFKSGGKLKESANIIPNGVSHEEENKLGTKGMPVIKCKKDSCKKVYEIESDELIITLDTTTKIEKLHKSKDLNKLGDFVMGQLLDNTHSFTKQYEYLN